jgi:anti-anti-sigma regulatory factor
MRILTRIDPKGPVTLLVIGGFNATCIADFERTVVAARRLGKEVRVDLSEVTVIDRSCLQCLLDLTRTGVAFVGWPPHVRHSLVDSASSDR